MAVPFWLCAAISEPRLLTAYQSVRMTLSSNQNAQGHAHARALRRQPPHLNMSESLLTPSSLYQSVDAGQVQSAVVPLERASSSPASVWLAKTAADYRSDITTPGCKGPLGRLQVLCFRCRSGTHETKYPRFRRVCSADIKWGPPSYVSWSAAMVIYHRPHWVGFPATSSVGACTRKVHVVFAVVSIMASHFGLQPFLL